MACILMCFLQLPVIKNLLNSTDLIFKCNTLTFVYTTSSVNYPCGALKRLQSAEHSSHIME